MKLLRSLAFCSLIISPASNLFADNQRSWLDGFLAIFSIQDEQIPHQQSQVSLNDQNNFNNHQIDYSKVRQQFRSAFDSAFSKSNHSGNDQREIERLCEKSSNHAIELLQTQYGNLSEDTAKRKARELAQSAAVEAVGIMTEQFVNAEISRIRNFPPINPEHLQPVDREYLANRLKQEMTRKAQAQITEKNGCLFEFAGKPLRDKITPQVEYFFGIYQKPTNTYQDPYAQLPAHQQPSAPPINDPAVNPQENNDGIKEIYLQVTGNRNKEYFNKIQSKVGLHRSDKCPSCLEEFKEIGKRVTLFCGHDACPQCLYNWLHTQNKNTCFICIRKIDKTELPANYLRQNI